MAVSGQMLKSAPFGFAVNAVVEFSPNVRCQQHRWPAFSLTCPRTNEAVKNGREHQRQHDPKQTQLGS